MMQGTQNSALVVLDYNAYYFSGKTVFLRKRRKVQRGRGQRDKMCV